MTAHPLHTADGTPLFLRDWGKGRPLLFLAGWTLASDMWAYQMAPLAAQGFRCIAYDRRGHGRSGDPGGGYDFDTLADDLQGVMETLALTDITLVAHSVASGEAVRCLTRHGAGRVGRLLLLAPAATPFLLKTADNPGGIERERLEAQRACLARGFPEWLEANAGPYFGPGAPRAAIDWTMAMMLRASHQAMLELARAQATTDFRPELARIGVPTLVIHGDADASAPLELTGRPTAARIPGAWLDVYEGAPHGLYYTHAERLNRDIAAFAEA
jgi:pimeloyl-ACP methyl ester carboxylesterase